MLLSTPAFERLSSVALRVPGELASMVFFLRKSPVVYVSPHNPGAAALLDVIAQACAAGHNEPILRAEAPPNCIAESTRSSRRSSGLRLPRNTRAFTADTIMDTIWPRKSSALTTDATRLAQGDLANGKTGDSALACATHFLLLLRSDTFEGEAAAELEVELRRALRAGMSPILVRLVDETAGGAPMDAIIRSTPTALRAAAAFCLRSEPHARRRARACRCSCPESSRAFR